MKRNLLLLLLLTTVSIQAQKFKTPFLQGSAIFAEYITKTDYDKDGDLDIVVGRKASIDLYLNNNGDFKAHEHNPFQHFRNRYNGATLNRGVRPVFGDINKDGHDDILIAYTVYDASILKERTSFDLFLNNGNGGYSQASNNDLMGVLKEDNVKNISILHSPYVCATLNDWDNDGDLDVILSTSSSAKYVEFVDGAFSNLSTANDPLGITIGHLSQRTQVLVTDPNKDGKKDLLYVDSDLKKTYFFKNENGSLNIQTEENNPYAKSFNAEAPLYGFINGLVLGDFDGDNKEDAFVLHHKWNHGVKYGTALFMKGSDNGYDFYNGANPVLHLKNGNNKFPVNNAIQIGDIENNGTAKLYALSEKNIYQFDLNGNLDETNSPFLAFRGNAEFETIDLVDWDKDGDLDMFTTIDRGYGSYLEYYEFDQNSFTLIKHPSSPLSNLGRMNYTDAAFGDINGDRHPDMVVRNYTGKLSYYENDKSGKLVEKTNNDNPFNSIRFGGIYLTNFNQYFLAAAGDLNGDGLIDLIGSSPYLASGDDGRVLILMQNQDKTFEALFPEYDIPNKHYWPAHKFYPALYRADASKLSFSLD